MKTLCIAQCGHRKIWKKYPNTGPISAKDAYIGVFSRKTQEYAKHFYPNDWCIISAKYGFLWPDELINDYNVTFKDPKTDPISIQELKTSAIKKELFTYDVFVVVAGKEYVNRVEKIFFGKKIILPLQGLRGNGNMMKAINTYIAKNTPG